MMRIRNEAQGNLSSRNVKYTRRNGAMMRVPQRGLWKFLIAKCKIYTEKWGMMRIPQGSEEISHHGM